MDLGTTMDVFTSFSKMAGAANLNDREMDGVDLSPVLRGVGQSPREEVYYYRKRDLFAMRLGAYKAHFITQKVYVGEERVYHDPPLLFNVEEDPSERFNIADEYPEVLDQIRKAVIAHQENMNPAPDLLKERGPEHLIEKY
jgi:arylsulfatase A-like enzyme